MPPLRLKQVKALVASGPHPIPRRGLLAESVNDGRQSVGYPKWAWILAVLTFFPLIPMAVGTFLPSTRRYLGFIGVFASSVGILVLLVVVIAVSVPGDDAGQKPRRSSPAQSRPLISSEIKSIILTTIKDHPLVLDAALEQYDIDINLVLVVSPITNESGAKELGEDFVRLTKTLSPDTPPSRSVGFGIYDYLIGVYYPDETLVVMGAKVRSSDRISW